MHLERVAHRERAADQRARRDAAEAAHLEGAVDGEPRRALARRARGRLGELGGERLAQRRQPLARARRHAHDRRAGERRRRQQRAYLLQGELCHLRFHQVEPRQRHDAAPKT